MGCDILAALQAATVGNHALLGLNSFGPGPDQPGQCFFPQRVHSPGENIQHPRVALPEARQTANVLGTQTAGAWGLLSGCNEHRLFSSLTTWKSRLANEPGQLQGSDIVRLILERCSSARQAVDVATDLIERFGQAGPQGDHVFLIADPHEAFVIEAAGSTWALLECHQTRAVCDVGLVRQDWSRLSRGLAERVIEQNWWTNDGTKIDFHAGLADRTENESSAMRRWSRATLTLAQQEGAIDAYCLRRLLLDHYEQCLELSPRAQVWHGAQIASLAPKLPPILWTAPGHLGVVLFFPLIAGVPLPDLWLEGLPPMSRGRVREESRSQEIQDRLQAQFDQDVEQFLMKATQENFYGGSEDLQSRAQAMMTRHAEMWVSETRSGRDAKPIARPSHANQMFEFVTE